jgi:hypothetical protein
MTKANTTHWLRDLAERLRLLIQGDGIIDEHDITMLIELAEKFEMDRPSEHLPWPNYAKRGEIK